MTGYEAIKTLTLFRYQHIFIHPSFIPLSIYACRQIDRQKKNIHDQDIALARLSSLAMDALGGEGPQLNYSLKKTLDKAVLFQTSPLKSAVLLSDFHTQKKRFPFLNPTSSITKP